MIFFYGEGRLGNQVFQYHALSTIAKHSECIVSVGLEDLERCFDLHGPRLFVLTRNRALKRVIKYVLNPLLLRPLSKTLRLWNYACETRCEEPPHEGASGVLSMRSGLLGNLTFVDGGHYQNSSFWRSLFPTSLLSLNADLRDAAKKYLDSTCGREDRLTFVHVRRGDYLTHTDYGLADLSLPADFYRAAIKELASRIGPTHLVFVTDDPKWVENNFGDIPGKTLVSFDAAMDFAIMTKCTSAILSNSTFSLAASLMLDNPDIVIAPRYWFGFRVSRWFPPQLQFVHDRMLYLSVLSEQRTAL
jgi:Glycosyl transferase family 11